MVFSEGKIKSNTNAVYGQGRRMYSVLSVLFFLSGIFSILMAVDSVEGVEYERQLVFSAAAILCIVLWLFACFARHIMPWILDAVVIIAGYFMLSDLINIAEELRSIGYNASNMHEEALLHAEDVTKAVLLLTISLVVLLFAFEFVLETHMISFLLATGVLILAPILGVKLSLLNLLLFAVFLFGLMAMHVTGRGRGRSLTEERRTGLSGYIGLIAALITALLFFVAVPFTVRYKEQLYEFVFQAEENVTSLTRNINRRFRAMRSSGYINRGNNYRNDDLVVHINFNKLPEDAIYLKTFAGDSYDSRQWTASDEMAFYRNVAAATAEGKSEEEAAADAWTAHFMMNRIMSGFDDNVYELKIKHLREGETGVYRPYFALNTEREEGVDESYAVSDMNRLVPAGTLPPEPSADETAALDMYRRINVASLNIANQMYTSVDVPLTRLRELVADNPLQSVEEVTAFIIYILHSNCRYTTTPGHAPMNADIAEYFLFESKRGYCQQFASVATLMYRLYGIPARYAAGYRVQLEDVKLNEGGGFSMDVSETFSHAWPEIFLDGYGWTPIEVTPGENGEVIAEYPGMSTEMLMSLMDEHGWRLAVTTENTGRLGDDDSDPDSIVGAATGDSEASEKGHTAEPPELSEANQAEMNPDETDPSAAASIENMTDAASAEGDGSRADESGGTRNRMGFEESDPDLSDMSDEMGTRTDAADGTADGSKDQSGHRWKKLVDGILSVLKILVKIILWLVAIFAVIAAAALGVLRFRKHRLGKLRTMGAKKCGECYMDLLHFCGLLKEYEGVEPDFAAKLEEVMDAIDASEPTGAWTAEMAKQLAAAAFGPEEQCTVHTPEHNGTESQAAEGMRGIYFFTLKKVAGTVSPLKKSWLWLYYGA